MRINRKFHPYVVCKDKKHVAWVLLQQFVVRGFFLLKFLLMARLLGPEQLGLVGIALTSLAVLESVSDTGLLQAVIQKEKEVTASEIGAVWALQFTRGCLLFLLLIIFSEPIGALFGASSAVELIAAASILPLLRNSSHPGYILLQRDQNFRLVFIVEAVISLVDFLVTVGFIYFNFGAVSVIYGSVFVDAGRLMLTWTFLYSPIKINARWRSISELIQYGRWLWGVSLFNVILNQFDKVVVARWLGVTQFGMYQTASRLAQIAISDIAIALGGFLFPKISSLHHINPKAASDYFGLALRRVALLCGALAIASITLGPIILIMVLGEAWRGMIPILQIQSVSMWFGALIAVCVAYLKAVGQPKYISVATAFQLLVLCLPAHWVVSNWGGLGMAGLVAFSLFTSFVVMLLKIRSIA